MYHEREDGHAKYKKRAAQEGVNSRIKDFAIQRSVAKKLSDMDLTELPILQHFLVYIKTNSKKGFNPYKPECRLYWT
jgi:hypothetical protein